MHRKIAKRRKFTLKHYILEKIRNYLATQLSRFKKLFGTKNKIELLATYQPQKVKRLTSYAIPRQENENSFTLAVLLPKKVSRALKSKN